MSELDEGQYNLDIKWILANVKFEIRRFLTYCQINLEQGSVFLLVDDKTIIIFKIS